jgi:hypothetical protein
VVLVLFAMALQVSPLWTLYVVHAGGMQRDWPTQMLVQSV